jgi:microcystin degradation protein MlrC
MSSHCCVQQFCDIEHVGVHVLTTTDNDADLAERTGQEMASWIWEHRDRFLLELKDAEQAVAEALAVPRSERQGHPVVIHETSDNCGGGATGDATFLLAAMLQRGPYERGEACFGFIVDPEAVTLAADAGVGSVLPELRLGGELSAVRTKATPSIMWFTS